MIQQDLEILQNVSKKLAKITLRLANLSEQKSRLVREIEGRVDELYDKMTQNFNNGQITLKVFSSKFRLKSEQLQSVLFQQYRTKIQQLTSQRIQDYLKVSHKSSRKKHSTASISQPQIKRFISIVENQIQILAETRQLFQINSQKVEKIFEQIDFFNNQYIDCTSLTQFFRHYSQDERFSQKGCILLIQIIKGSEYSSDKLFYQDLIQFMEDKTFINSAQKDDQFQTLKKQELSARLKKNFEKKNRFLSVQQEKNIIDSNFIKTVMLKQKRKQSSPDRSIPSSINDDKLIDLSMSQSLLSPTSAKNRNDPMFDSIFNSISSNLKTKNNKFQEKNSTEKKKRYSQLKNPKLINQDDYIKLENYQLEFNKNSKVNTQQKMKQKFSILQQQPLSVKFKGFYQEKSQKLENTNQFKQTKKIHGQNSKNTFQTNLIKSHSRNSAYLTQVKLLSSSIPKVVQENKHVKSQQKTYDRPCLQGKISIFEKKKVELIYSLQFISAQYEKWYNSIVELISQNDKFNFTNAFNVIDMKETNNVTYNQFVEFLNDCRIEKVPSKVQWFFDFFSSQKYLKCQEDTSNKQNIDNERFDILKSKHNEQIQETQKVIRFSNFLKMFCLNKAIPIIKKCKQRPAKVQLVWDDKMRKSYCNFLRIVIDTVYQIQNMKKQVKKTYLKMRQVWKEQTFQKTFGREILRFEQMQKLLKCNCLTFLCQISKDDQYIDEQKLFKYFSIEESEIN